MQYMLMEYVRGHEFFKLAEAEQQRWIGLVKSYIETLTKAGVLQAANALEGPGAATTVRTTDGKLQVLDGPYADTKEQIGGYYLIDVPDLDAALSWASRSPTAIHGVVEIRPVATHAMARDLEESRRRALESQAKRGE